MSSTPATAITETDLLHNKDDEFKIRFFSYLQKVSGAKSYYNDGTTTYDVTLETTKGEFFNKLVGLVQFKFNTDKSMKISSLFSLVNVTAIETLKLFKFCENL
jgi:hypothetical protein